MRAASSKFRIQYLLPSSLFLFLPTFAGPIYQLPAVKSVQMEFAESTDVTNNGFYLPILVSLISVGTAQFAGFLGKLMKSIAMMGLLLFSIGIRIVSSVCRPCSNSDLH